MFEVARTAANGLSIRQAAEEAGVSASTFSRVVNSGHVPDYTQMLHLAHWLGVTLVQLSVDNEPSSRQLVTSPVEHSPRETTLESIALHLHADEDLSPQDVDLLMGVLRVQYSLLKQRTQR